MLKPNAIPLVSLLCGAVFAVTLVGCQKNETPPPPPVVVAVPGPAGATGATGATGDTGRTGSPGGDTTVIVVPPPASAPTR